MKILDRYLIKQFLQTIFFAILALILIFVVIDMMENLDDFIDQNVPADVILHYYFVFTPEIIRLITPIAVLFGALFTAGKAAQLSELTAIKASGVSLFRFMLPFIIVTFGISIFSILFSGYAVPMANKTKINIEMTYLKRGISFTGSNIFFQDTRTRIISISYFDNNRNMAHTVSIQEFNRDDLTEITSRIDAKSISFDSLKNTWVAKNVTERHFGALKQSAKYYDTLALGYVNFKPADLLTKQQKPEEMNLSELRQYINTQYRAGNDPTNTLIEYHSRFAFSAASLIVLLFGLPISANKRKGGLAVQVGLNILVAFIYLVFMKISQAFGKNGVMDPVLTAWLSNLLFLAAAMVNLPRFKQ
jgi:lipopolysaccharide export system permease protein